jgi:hypothetical protein
MDKLEGGRTGGDLVEVAKKTTAVIAVAARVV